MTTYQEITRRVGDQWVAALKQAEHYVETLARGAQEARGSFEVPQLPVPEPLTRLNEALSERLPKPSEVVQANFELTERLLSAQRDLTLRLLEVTGADVRAGEVAAKSKPSAAESSAARKTAATSTGAKSTGARKTAGKQASAKPAAKKSTRG